MQTFRQEDLLNLEIKVRDCTCMIITNNLPKDDLMVVDYYMDHCCESLCMVDGGVVGATRMVGEKGSRDRGKLAEGERG